MSSSTAKGIPGRIPGPLETCQAEAVKYYKETLGRFDFSTGKQVSTTYGQTWTYKFGPDNAPKIFFIHGINTSCLSLADLALPLSQGYQVLLFDLYGRGLSDGTRAVKHDEKLYVDQAKQVLDAYDWKEKMIVVGYSMGGSIAVHLNNMYPELIDHLFLLGPAGLIRRLTFGFDKIVVFGFPEGLITALQHKLLKGNMDGRNQQLHRAQNPEEKALLENPTSNKDANLIIRFRRWLADMSKERDPPKELVIQEGSTLEEVVCYSSDWFIANHHGFLAAISASVKDAPLYCQNAAWDKLKERKGRRTTTVVLGTEDDKVKYAEFNKDVEKIVEDGNMSVHTLKGAPHHFPMTHPQDTLEIIRGVLEGGDAPK